MPAEFGQQLHIEAGAPYERFPQLKMLIGVAKIGVEQHLIMSVDPASCKAQERKNKQERKFTPSCGVIVG
eukprot:2724560-Amphidinium_carterae.1